jgi:hypothetical protein
MITTPKLGLKRDPCWPDTPCVNVKVAHTKCPAPHLSLDNALVTTQAMQSSQSFKQSQHKRSQATDSGISFKSDENLALSRNSSTMASEQAGDIGPRASSGSGRSSGSRRQNVSLSMGGLDDAVLTPL